MGGVIGLDNLGLGGAGDQEGGGRTRCPTCNLWHGELGLVCSGCADAAAERLRGPWARVCGELRRELTDFAVHTWIRPLRPLRCEESVLVLWAPGHVRSWVRDRYLPVVVKCARKALNDRALTVELVG